MQAGNELVSLRVMGRDDGGVSWHYHKAWDPLVDCAFLRNTAKTCIQGGAGPEQADLFSAGPQQLPRLGSADGTGVK